MNYGNFNNSTNGVNISMLHNKRTKDYKRFADENAIGNYQQIKKEFKFTGNPDLHYYRDENNLKENEVFVKRTEFSELASNIPNDPNQKKDKENYIDKNVKNKPKLLPIDNHRDEILKTIDKNQVTIICGETGCGKTTKVPEFLYKHSIDKLRKEQQLTNPNFNGILFDTKKHCNILITQPRRIAAISIANRLKKTIDPGIIGYHVGMDPCFNEFTHILIVTTGIFLQRLINQNDINEFTHIIIDEVHERDINIDMTLVMIKHLLKNSKTKLILMSATISTHLFANFFSTSDVMNVDTIDYYNSSRYGLLSSIEEELYDDKGWPIRRNFDEAEKKKEIVRREVQNLDSRIQKGIIKGEALNYKDPDLLIKDKAPVIEIKDQVYPVKTFYLDKIIQNLDKDLKTDEMKNIRFNFEKKTPKIENDVYNLCAELIYSISEYKLIDDRNNENSVLIFLPGVGEIHALNEVILSKKKIKKERITVMHLHSNVSE